MKSKIIALLTISCSAIIQLSAQHEVPEKYDNQIIMIADTSASMNLKDLVLHLTNLGYTFSLIDNNNKLAYTNEKVSEGGYQHKLSILFKDSTISIRATCNMMLLGSSVGNYKTTWVDWEYAKSKFNIYNLHFRAFYPAISSFPHKRLLFYRR